jgi:hypothetical protein
MEFCVNVYAEGEIAPIISPLHVFRPTSVAILLSSNSQYESSSDDDTIEDLTLHTDSTTSVRTIEELSVTV